MDLSSLLSSSSIAHANPLLSAGLDLGKAALGTGGGILGSSSSATGTQGNTSIFGAAFQVGGRGNSSSANPDVSPTVSTAQVQPGGGGAAAGIAALTSSSALPLILGVVGVIVGVIALVKAH